MMVRPVALFFDLDGTLVDTAPDLAAALNRLLVEENRQPLPLETIRPQASNGSRGLLALGFDLQATDAGFQPLAQRFLEHYAAHLCEHSTLFPGMSELLTALERAAIPWGVITNKPRRFTLPLLAALQLDQRCCAIVSGDECPQPKPDPATILLGCARAGLSAGRHILYVGDDERDIVAGHAAGCTTVAATWGYPGSLDTVRSWQAEHIVSLPVELLALCNRHEMGKMSEISACRSAAVP